MCFCGLFPQLRRAWASIDNSLFLWRYDKRCARYSPTSLATAPPSQALLLAAGVACAVAVVGVGLG